MTGLVFSVDGAVFRQFGLQIGTFLKAADFIMRKLSLASPHPCHGYQRGLPRMCVPHSGSRAHEQLRTHLLDISWQLQCFPLRDKQRFQLEKNLPLYQFQYFFNQDMSIVKPKVPNARTRDLSWLYNAMGHPPARNRNRNIEIYSINIWKCIFDGLV